MRILALLLVPLVACVANPGDASREIEPVSLLRAEVEAMTRGMEERFRAGDCLGVAAFYADDAVLVGADGERITGREAIDEYWLEVDRNAEPGGRDWILDVLEVEGGGRLVHQRGRSTLVFRRNGQERRSVVDFILLWVRQPDGDLRIVLDAFW